MPIPPLKEWPKVAAESVSDLIKKLRKNVGSTFTPKQGLKVGKQNLLSRRKVLLGLVTAGAAGAFGIYATGENGEEDTKRGKTPGSANQKTERRIQDTTSEFLEIDPDEPGGLQMAEDLADREFLASGEPIPSFDQTVTYLSYMFNEPGVSYYFAPEDMNLLAWARRSEGIPVQEFHDSNRREIEKGLSQTFVFSNPYNVNLEKGKESPFVATSTPEKAREEIMKKASRPIETSEGEKPLIDFVRGIAEEEFKNTQFYSYLQAKNPTLAQHYIDLIVQGMISQESGWDYKAKSNAEDPAFGLFQITSGHFEHFLNKYEGAEHVRTNVTNKFSELKADSAEASTVIQKQAKIGVYSLDFSYQILNEKLGSDHWVFDEPSEAILIPLIINCHIYGANGIANLVKNFDEIYAESGIPVEFGTAGNRTADLFLFMGIKYHQKVKAFGRHSLPYTLKIHAWNELFKKYAEVEAEDSISSLEQMYPLASGQFIDAIQNGAEIHNALKPENAVNLLEKVDISLGGYKDSVTGLDISTFLEPKGGGINPSHDQPAVSAWLDAKDAFSRKYRSGLRNNEQLKAEINKLKGGSSPKIRNLVEHPHLTAYMEYQQPAGVEQEWRRVIRIDHLPVMDELNLRVNQLLLENGMSDDYFVSTMINSTVRSTDHNRKIHGSSTSAHLRFSGIDLNDKFYLVHKIEEDGTISRYRDDENLDVFLNALKIVAFKMAKEGKIKVRFHDGHFHMVPMVENG